METACNLPVIIHNLKGYDGHLIVKASKSEFGKLQVIPKNTEKYFSLAVGQLKFIYSFKFTPQGLDVLAKTLAVDEFRYLRESCTSFWSYPSQRCSSLCHILVFKDFSGCYTWSCLRLVFFSHFVLLAEDQVEMVLQVAVLWWMVS